MNTKHTCGGPKFGRLAPKGSCPRCDELHNGAMPVQWAKDRKPLYSDSPSLNMVTGCKMYQSSCLSTDPGRTCPRCGRDGYAD